MSGKAIRETLAALGVIASMVFVGMEIRQNTAVARGQTRQALTENYRDFNMALVTDADLFAAYVTVFRQDQPVDDAARSRAVRAMFVDLRLLENVFLQVQERVVDESVFQSYGWVGRAEFSGSSFRDLWSEIWHLFNSDFVAAFEAEYDLAP